MKYYLVKYSLRKKKGFFRYKSKICFIRAQAVHTALSVPVLSYMECYNEENTFL